MYIGIFVYINLYILIVDLMGLTDSTAYIIYARELFQTFVCVYDKGHLKGNLCATNYIICDQNILVRFFIIWKKILSNVYTTTGTTIRRYDWNTISANKSLKINFWIFSSCRLYFLYCSYIHRCKWKGYL